jgi:hypothetical protein
MLLNVYWIIEEIKEEIKNFLESNENENTVYLWYQPTYKGSAKGKHFSYECLH